MMVKCKFTDHTSGMSLIEVIVVLAILSAIFTLIAGSMTKPRNGSELRIIVSKLASQLRAARATAINKNKSIAFVFDAPNRSYHIENVTKITTLPNNIDLKITTARKFVRHPTMVKLVFFPDGSSSGGRIMLSSQNQRTEIGIAWLTGAIIVEAPLR